LLGVTEALAALVSKGHDVNGVDDMGWTPLHWACTGSAVDPVVKLLKLGANPNKENLEGLLPIHNAAQNGRIDTIDVLLKGGSSITTHGGLILEELISIAPNDFCKQWIRKKAQDLSNAQTATQLSEREILAMQRLKAKQQQQSNHHPELGPLPAETPDFVLRRSTALLAKHVNSWTVNDVVSWSKELNLSQDYTSVIQVV